MVVKYYGYGELPNPSNANTYRNAAIEVFVSQSVDELSRYMHYYNSSASIMLVPGTFDEEGRHVE